MPAALAATCGTSGKFAQRVERQGSRDGGGPGTEGTVSQVPAARCPGLSSSS